MAVYIDREALIKKLKKDPLFPLVEQYGITGVIESFPASDVRPVVRGKWTKPTRVPDSMLSECSVCGFDTGAYTFNYCPNCGAKMEVQDADS